MAPLSLRPRCGACWSWGGFASAIIIAAAMLSLSGCVVLTSQRLTLFHDEPADRLLVLIHYDGIHDNEVKPGEASDDVDQLAEFARAGDVMLLDWFGHLKRQDIEQVAVDINADPGERALARLLVKHLHTQPVGHYQDLRGRVGGLQLVRIEQVSKVITALNTLMNEQLFAEAPEDDEQLPGRWRLTLRRFIDQARQGHQWLALNGHSLEIHLPVHPREWRANRGQLVYDEVLAWIEHAWAGEDADHLVEQMRTLRLILQVAGQAPASLIESRRGLVVRLGEPTQPHTLRVTLPDRQYNGSLNEPVIQLLPDDVDQQLAARLIDWPPDAAEQAGQSDTAGAEAVEGTADPIDLLIRWGPAEHRAKVLARASLALGDAELQSRARHRLDAWSKAWNAQQAIPPAPGLIEDDQAFMEAWTQWYDQVLAFPMAQVELPRLDEKPEARPDAGGETDDQASD